MMAAAGCFIVSVCKTSDADKLLVDSGTTRYAHFFTIYKVKPGGLIDRWNEEHDEAQVKPGDRIFEVNETHGHKDKLYDAIADSTDLRLKVIRGRRNIDYVDRTDEARFEGY